MGYIHSTDGGMVECCTLTVLTVTNESSTTTRVSRLVSDMSDAGTMVKLYLAESKD